MAARAQRGGGMRTTDTMMATILFRRSRGDGAPVMATSASAIAVKASSKLSSNDKILVEALAGARASRETRGVADARIETTEDG
mgnify:FL=1